MLSLNPLCLLYIYILAFLWLTLVCLLTLPLQPCLFFFFFFLLQSSATRPILLDEPESEVQLFPFIFLYIPFAMCLQPCPFSFLLVMVSFVPHSSSSLSSSRISPSRSPYTIPQPRSFLPPRAHPWKVSLRELMLCLGP